MAEAAGQAYCTTCGAPAAGADHRRCASAGQWEPPRYCGTCGRRMVVQVLPRGWTARCVAHGTLASPAAS